MAVTVDKSKCTICGICVDICPEDILSKGEDEIKVVYPNECWYCGSCMIDCPQGAIKVNFPHNSKPVFLRSDSK